MAAKHPDRNFLGIEVHDPGVGHCLLKAEAAGLTNLRLIRHDAVEVLADWLPEKSCQRVQLFFPDPWPKKRHHKRRIVQPSFVALLARVLEPDGIFHVATDWAGYAEHVRAVMREAPGFERAAPDIERPVTRFERRGQRLGHAIVDLAWRRTAGS